MYRKNAVMFGGHGCSFRSKYVYVYGAAAACAYCPLGLDRTSSKREALTVTAQTWGIRSSLLRTCLDVSLHPPPPYPKKSVNDTLWSSGRACLGSRHLLSRRAPRYRDAGAVDEACRPALATIPPWSCIDCVSGCLVAAARRKGLRGC